MATLVHTPRGQWKALVRLQGWPTVSKTFRTKRDAQDWARHAEDEMVRGVFVNRASSHRISFSVAMDRYMAEVSPVKRGSTGTRERSLAKTLKEHLGRYSLVALTPNVISEYRDARLAEGRAGNTVRLELALLSHLFTTALREWHLGLLNNPVLLVRKPSAGRGRERRLKGNEESELLSECDTYSNPMFGWIVRLALLTGMRSGEITSLRLSQVDLESRVIRLTQTKNGSARTVPLGKQATAVLKTALKHPLRPSDTDLVFFGEPGRSGKRGPYWFAKQWRLTKQKLGLHDLHFHDLRHEAVSRLVEAGLSDQEVSAISGHKSMQMLKRYTHLRAEDLVAKLDRIR
ncbi:MAG: site-specific integrase [Pseudomonadota bacterium]